MATVTRGKDSSTNAYKTGRACIVGLTDICSAASSEAPKSPVIKGICSAVYRTVLSFFISTFEGKDIHRMDSIKMLQDPMKLLVTLKLELGNANQTCDSLFELGAFCFLCIFLLFPENVLEACFTLLAAESDDVKGEGLYLLNQLTCHLNSNAANNALDDKIDGQSSGTEGNLLDIKKIVDSNPSSNDNVDLENSIAESNECYITMVWIIFLLVLNFHLSIK